MFKESHTTHTAPAYYVYPGLKAIILPPIQDCCSPDERLEFIMHTVKEEFAKRFRFDMERMMSHTREMPYPIARMAFYYFARIQCPTLTLKEISRSFSELRQHHTTLLHACQAVQNIIDTRDPLYYDAIMAIEERLK